MAENPERRNVLKGAVLVAGAAAVANLIDQPVFAQTTAPVGAQPMTYQIKPLSLDPKSIKGMSEKVIVSHYENNYVGAGQTAQRDWRETRQSRFRKGADVSDQWPQTRGIARYELDDPA